MAGWYTRYQDVVPQLPSPQGIQVEMALEKFRNEVSFPYFITGQVDDCPALKVSVSKPEQKEVTFENPYAGVEELYSNAEQSQVGTAQKTIFRFDARKSREYSTVHVLNDSWHEKVTAVCHQIGQALAPGAKKVNAELYKLLLYTKGDFFNLHQDAQYSARMFATLLFFLPVKYSGGEFVLCDPFKFRDEVTIEDKKLDDRCTWVAFYTDVRHRVKEVKEGYRVVLSYCLSFEGDMSPSHFLPRFNHSTTRTIHNCFTISGEKNLAVPLAYKYTQATLSPTFLKGIDACLFSALEGVAVSELCFVLRFDKTKLIRGRSYDDEDDHKQIFQGIFLVDHKTAQKYLSLQQSFDKELADFKGDREAHHELRSRHEEEFAALNKKVKASHGKREVEWIVKRNSSGMPDWNTCSLALSFKQGSMGWLGNMTPAAEYYYLSAAIVVFRKKI